MMWDENLKTLFTTTVSFPPYLCRGTSRLHAESASYLRLFFFLLKGHVTDLESRIPADVPQLDVGLDEPVVDVQVGRLELEDADAVGRAVGLRDGRLRRVGDEVGQGRFAGLYGEIKGVSLVR